jgi:hypothetical protein
MHTRDCFKRGAHIERWLTRVTLENPVQKFRRRPTLACAEMSDELAVANVRRDSEIPLLAAGRVKLS